MKTKSDGGWFGGLNGSRSACLCFCGPIVGLAAESGRAGPAFVLGLGSVGRGVVSCAVCMCLVVVGGPTLSSFFHELGRVEAWEGRGSRVGGSRVWDTLCEMVRDTWGTPAPPPLRVAATARTRTRDPSVHVSLCLSPYGYRVCVLYGVWLWRRIMVHGACACTFYVRVRAS